jgi:hypothetical protein
MNLALFEERSIDELLFEGYKVPFLDRFVEKMKEQGLTIPITLPFNNTFGLMMGRNNSDSGLVTIHTGLNEDDIYQVHSWEATSK